MPAMSPILAICMMSFCGGSPGRSPSSTSLFSLGVAVSDLDGGCVGAPFAGGGGPAALCGCAMVGIDGSGQTAGRRRVGRGQDKQDGTKTVSRSLARSGRGVGGTGPSPSLHGQRGDCGRGGAGVDGKKLGNTHTRRAVVWELEVQLDRLQPLRRWTCLCVCARVLVLLRRGSAAPQETHQKRNQKKKESRDGQGCPATGQPDEAGREAESAHPLSLCGADLVRCNPTKCVRQPARLAAQQQQLRASCSLTKPAASRHKRPPSKARSPIKL